jgi:hypothetical protein
MYSPLMQHAHTMTAYSLLSLELINHHALHKHLLEQLASTLLPHVHQAQESIP